MAHDVFISYSSKNKATADAICHALEQSNIRCWVAPRNIPPGTDYGDVIEKSILSCKVFLLVFSEFASISPWVKAELNIAFSESKHIIPFRIDSTPLVGGMRLILNQTHWLDAYPNPQEYFSSLITTVSSIVNINTKDIKTNNSGSAEEKGTVHKKEESTPKVNINNSVCVRIGNLIVSDRNLGAPEGGVALNYTNDENHVDHKNSLFKGRYYTWEEAKNACPSGWRLPTKDELSLIQSKMKHSDVKALEDSSGNRCYFPLSGFSSGPSDVSGRYWSSTEGDGSSAWSLYVTTSLSLVLNIFKSNGLSVRCVKTVP